MGRPIRAPRYKANDVVNGWAIVAYLRVGIRRSNGAYQHMYLCRCSCGVQQEKTERLLSENGSKLCRSCAAKSMQLKSERKVGKLFGKLRVLRDSGERSGRARRYVCSCLCGGETTVRGDYLLTPAPSCGCDLKSKIGLPPGEAHLNAKFRSYKRGALIRNMPFNLTREQFSEIVSLPCVYCGAEPDYARLGYATTNGCRKMSGVDRVDNDRGYGLDNVVPCCSFCNRAKGTQSVADFKRWVNAVQKQALAGCF